MYSEAYVCNSVLSPDGVTMEVLFTVSSTLDHALAKLALLQNDHIICLHVKVFFFSSKYLIMRGSFDSLFIVWNNEAKDFKQGMLYLLRCNDWVEASEHVALIEFAWEWPQMAKKLKEFWSWKKAFFQTEQQGQDIFTVNLYLLELLL